MAKKETAEQKLLKIIESQKGAETQSFEATSPGGDVAQQMAASVKGTGVPSISLPPIFSPILNLIGMLKGAGSSKTPGAAFGIREINNLMVLAVFGICVLLMLNVMSGMKSLEREVSFEVKVSNSVIPESFVPSLKSFDEFLEHFKKRNIFLPFEQKVEEIIVEIPEAESTKIFLLVKNLKLVGISWLDTPESASVMIEDTLTGTTYFLRQGQGFRNLTVKVIYADRVILTAEGEETALRL